MRRLILASASPRRRELLGQLGLEFECVAALCEEAASLPVAPVELCLELARRKAGAIARRAPDALVIGADTIVVCDGQILGKPCGAEDARRMLRMLSDKSHEVLTGIVVEDARTGERLEDFEKTTVWFREVLEGEIEAYIASGEPLDKAGAYGIQGKGAVFVKGINGCYFNVVGLPLFRLAGMLARFGIRVLG